MKSKFKDPTAHRKIVIKEGTNNLERDKPSDIVF